MGGMKDNTDVMVWENKANKKVKKKNNAKDDNVNEWKVASDVFIAKNKSENRDEYNRYKLIKRGKSKSDVGVKTIT